MADGGLTRRSVPGVVAALAVLALVAGVIAGGFYAINRYIAATTGPTIETVANASLQGLREQNRLSAFAAQFVAVVTSKQSRLGLSTQKTLIMPGLVRYEVDLARLKQGDVRWDKASRTLFVALPPVRADGPQIDLNRIREYGDNGLLTIFTNAGQALDAANRAAGQRELLRQAAAPPMIALARDATRRAVERSFAMPLAAVGIDARVKVRFADEARPSDERWDVSKSIGEVLGNDR